MQVFLHLANASWPLFLCLVAPRSYPQFVRGSGKLGAGRRSTVCPAVAGVAVLSTIRPRSVHRYGQPKTTTTRADSRKRRIGGGRGRPPAGLLPGADDGCVPLARGRLVRPTTGPLPPAAVSARNSPSCRADSRPDGWSAMGPNKPHGTRGRR